MIEVMLVFTGRQLFLVYIPWAHKDLKQAFRFWRNALCFNTVLAADYPEFCDPFAHAKGIPQRVQTTTWTDTDESTHAQLTVGEGLIVMPGNPELGCALSWLLSVASAAPADGAAEALELARACTQVSPNNPRGHDVLAAAYAANGDFEAAVASIDRAIELAQGPAAPLRPEFEARRQLYTSGRRYSE